MNVLSLRDLNLSRRAALKHLNKISPQLGNIYRDNRNFDKGPLNHDAVTKLSPSIRHRILLEQEAIRITLLSHSFHNAEKFITEIFWHTYWKGWLEMRPTVWQDYKNQRDQDLINWQNNVKLIKALEGDTGIECFNSWVKELRETNYLHNHARMWFASIWIFTLQLPWTLGADFFLKHLLDGDPASNTLSWRWVAGLQTRGKAYLAVADNIRKFTLGRFNPENDIITTAQPLEWQEPPKPQRILQNEDVKSNVPTLLIVTEDDLSIRDAPLPHSNIVGIISLNSTKDRSITEVSDSVLKFSAEAIDVSVTDYVRMNATHITYISDGPIGEIPKIAHELGVSQIVSLYSPVGPSQDTVGKVNAITKKQGLPIITIMRDWDTNCWPYATKGFFKFKEAIPTIIKQFNLT